MPVDSDRIVRAVMGAGLARAHLLGFVRSNTFRKAYQEASDATIGALKHAHAQPTGRVCSSEERRLKYSIGNSRTSPWSHTLMATVIKVGL